MNREGSTEHTYFDLLRTADLLKNLYISKILSFVLIP